MAGANGARRSSPTSRCATTVSAPSPTRPPSAPRCWSARARGFSLHAAYGEGIAQPTFYDLYGFFPGSFAGNPALKPETLARLGGGDRLAGRARSAWTRPASRAGCSDEIVDTFDPATFLSSTANATGEQPAQGRRAQRRLASGRRGLNLAANYTWLDAERAARRRRHRAGPRGAAAAQQLQLCRLWRERPASLGREPRLCRQAAGPGFRLLPGADGDARRLCAGFAPISPGGSCRSWSSMRGRKMRSTPIIRTWSATHAGTDDLCGSSRRFWPLALAARRGARRRPRRGGWRR